MRIDRELVATFLFLPVVGALAAPAAADTEDELKAAIVGRYGLVRSPVLSECTDHYTDNEVVGGRTSGRVGERFAAGELVRVDNVKVGVLVGVQLNLSLVEPRRLTWKEGPYELHDQRRCRVQLHFDLPRDVRKDAGRVRAAIEAAVALFDQEAAAKADPSWNRREVEAYPAGWEATKREWEAWRRGQRNRRVREKTESVLEEADRILTYMQSGDGYLASFGAGARARGSESWSDCDAMLDATFYVTGSASDSRGWHDGQFIAWSSQLARALADCYVDDGD